MENTFANSGVSGPDKVCAEVVNRLRGDGIAAVSGGIWRITIPETTQTTGAGTVLIHQQDIEVYEYPYQYAWLNLTTNKTSDLWHYADTPIDKIYDELYSTLSIELKEG